jgi:transcriptional regulator with XRE-family HTH domain
MRSTEADPAFIKRLEEIISYFPSRAALAKTAGLSPSSLQSYVEGAEPTRPVLVALARAANVSLEWLADNRGYKQPHPPVPDGYAAIPAYDIRKAGGYVYPLVMAESAYQIYLKLDLFSYPGMEPGKLFVVEAMQSFASEIKDGDLLVVDSSWHTRFVDPLTTLPPGNYLISRQAKLSIRQAIGGHHHAVVFAAPDAPSRKRTFRVGEDGFAVHGRIIWYGRSLPSAGAAQIDTVSQALHRRKIH